MPKPSEMPINSFKEYIEIVEDLRSKSPNSLWFRGCGKASYSLVPTLFRNTQAKNKASFEQLERQLMVRFRQRSIPFHARTLTDEWDALFFMQHYGVPTRLLDWTENPFIAFYFAVTSAHVTATSSGGKGQPRVVFPSDAAIWIFDPSAWNNHAMSQQGNHGILTPGDPPLHAYTPLRQFKDIPIHPVALYGAHNSPRIVAQRGVFTIFGQEANPMEEVFSQHQFPRTCLTKIILRRSKLSQLRSSILHHGITESVVFPDLEGLAREMKREFRFEQ